MSNQTFMQNTQISINSGCCFVFLLVLFLSFLNKRKAVNICSKVGIGIMTFEPQDATWISVSPLSYTLIRNGDS